MSARCKICNKTMATYERLAAHVRDCHGVLKNREEHIEKTIAACEYPNCSFSTWRSYDYVKHIKKVHLKVNRLHLNIFV